MIDGEPPAEANVSLQGRGEGLSVTCGQFLAEPDGSFRAQGLPPGRYRASLIVPISDSARWFSYHSAEEIDLSSGAQADHLFRFEHRAFKIRFLELDGKTPLGLLPCQSSCDLIWTDLMTDAEGWLVIEPVPPVPFDIPIRGHRFGPFMPPTLERVAIQEVAVPPKSDLKDGR